MKLFYYAISVAFLFSLSEHAFSGMPVFDYASFSQLARQINQMKEQYALLESTYQNSQAQLKQVTQLNENMQGHYGMGDLLNKEEDLKTREWSPKSWQGALKGMSGSQDAQYNTLVQTYHHEHPALTEKEYRQGGTQAQFNRYWEGVKENRAARVHARYTFNGINEHIRKVHALSKKIEQSKNEKSSLDLNARLLLEIAYIQLQSLKMNAVENEQLSQSGRQPLVSQEANVKFNQTTERK